MSSSYSLSPTFVNSKDQRKRKISSVSLVLLTGVSLFQQLCDQSCIVPAFPPIFWDHSILFFLPACNFHSWKSIYACTYMHKSVSWERKVRCIRFLLLSPFNGISYCCCRRQPFFKRVRSHSLQLDFPIARIVEMVVCGLLSHCQLFPVSSTQSK